MILVNQKFIILQGLHILGKIQVATPPLSELDSSTSITVFERSESAKNKPYGQSYP